MEDRFAGEQLLNPVVAPAHTIIDATRRRHTMTLFRRARGSVVSALGIAVVAGAMAMSIAATASAQVLSGTSGQTIANFTPPSSNTTDPAVTVGVVQSVADIDEDGKQDIVLTEVSFDGAGRPRFQTRVIDGTTHRVKLLYDNQPNTGSACGNGVVESGEQCDRGELNVPVCGGNPEDCRDNTQAPDNCKFCGPLTGPRAADR
jgi:hypothetical protein